MIPRARTGRLRLARLLHRRRYARPLFDGTRRPDEERTSLYGVGPFGLEPLVLCMVITLLRPQPALVGRRARRASLRDEA